MALQPFSGTSETFVGMVRRFSIFVQSDRGSSFFEEGKTLSGQSLFSIPPECGREGGPCFSSFLS